MEQPALEVPKQRMGRLKPRTFARAVIEGKTLAEAARIGGSLAEGDHALEVVGSRWIRRPKVVALLSEVQADLLAGWAGGVRWWMDAARGAVKVTDQDRIQIISNLGHVLGKYIQRIEVSSTQRVEVMGFLATASAPTLQTASIEAIEAELARRKALPAGDNVRNQLLAERSVAAEVVAPLDDSAQGEAQRAVTS